MARHLSNSGLGLLCKCCTLAAASDLVPAAVLLSKSFRLGSTQFIPFTPTCHWLDALVRSYRTPQHKQQRRHKNHRSKHVQDTGLHSAHKYSAESDDDQAFWGVPSSSFALNRNRTSPRNSKQHTSDPRKQSSHFSNKHQNSAHHRSSNASRSLRGADLAAAAAAQDHAASATSAAAGQHSSSKQHQQPLPELPTAIGVWSSSNDSSSKAVSAVPGASDISDSHLMALLHRARTIRDMEQILLQYHANFRYNHVAAALSALPHLQAETSYNSRARMVRLTSLIASAVIPVAHQFDAHQTLACLRALTRKVCFQPLQVPALNRLLSVLLQDDGKKLWKLLSDELADCAAAAAVMHQALQQQQQRRRSASTASSIDNATTSSSSSSSRGRIKLEAGSKQAHALQTSESSSSSSSSSSGALALQSPLQQLWPHLLSVVQPQLNNFSAASLALLLLSSTTAHQTTDELLLLTVAAALSRSHKFEDPVTVTNMLQALALYNIQTQSSQISSKPVQQLLAVLSDTMAQHKADFTTQQLIDCVTALADLDFYCPAACLAVCKIGCRTLKQWQPQQVVAAVNSLVKFRFRDEQMLKLVVKYMKQQQQQQQQQRGLGVLSVEQCADLLVGLLQLSYTGTEVEELMVEVLRDLGHRDAAEVTQSAAAKLLWVTAVLDETNATLQKLLLSRLAAGSEQQQQQQQQNESELRLLYQAHRLTTVEWLNSDRRQQQQQQQQQQGHKDAWVEGKDLDQIDDADADGDDHDGEQQQSITYVVIGEDVSSSNSSSEYKETAASQQQKEEFTAAASAGWTVQDLSRTAAAEADWPASLLAAARRAAASYSIRSCKRSRSVQQHVQDLFEEMGLDAPVQGFKIDGGSMQPDLAFIAQGKGLDLKVALMCDHDGRYSRNMPFQLLGYETVEGWLLEQAGWKVVRLTPHEWELILEDDRVHTGSALAFLHNTLAAQGLPL